MTELHSFIYSEKLVETKLDLFLSPNFKMKLGVLWYIKMLTEIIRNIALLYVMGMVSKKISIQFFHVSVVWMVFNIADFFFFMWNYKDTAEMYWVLLLASALSLHLLIFTKDKNTILKAV